MSDSERNMTPSDISPTSSSFLQQLQSKLKLGLVPTTTKTTFPDGTVQYATEKGLNLAQLEEQGKRGYGFVVDDKPDHTVGQIRPWLYISSQDVPYNIDVLRDTGITHILSLLPGFTLPTEVRILLSDHKVLEIYDEEQFQLRFSCNEAFQFMDKVKTGGGKLLVHCNAGVSRAPSLVIAYFILQEDLSFEEAWDQVKTGRPVMKPNEGFVKQLKTMKS